MRIFVPEENHESFIKALKANRLESNIMVIRKKAIWSNRNPDLAEKQYRSKVLENERKKQLGIS